MVDLDRYYQYSTAGLSHKFDLRARVLQKLNVEDKEKKVELKKFKEFSELCNGEIIITIEHW